MKIDRVLTVGSIKDPPEPAIRNAASMTPDQRLVCLEELNQTLWELAGHDCPRRLARSLEVVERASR